MSILLCSVAFAEVSIETSVSRSRLSVGEELTLDIIITNAQGQISQPAITSISGFSSYSQGRSQEISVINGETTSRNIFSYVLIANDVGKRTIGPFEVSIGSKTYKVAPVEVEVVPDTGAGAGAPPPATQGPVYSPPSRALPSGDVSSQDIFVKAWLDKDEVYVNEPAMLTYTIYTRLSATYKGFDKEPVTTGFWVEDFPPDKTTKKTEQIFNGRRYVVADVRKLALFPTQPGVYAIDTGVISSAVEIRQQEQDDFDSFFSYNMFGRRSPAFSPFITTQVIQKNLIPDKVTLTVKALPEAGKPSNFSGAVGDYRIEGSMDKREVEQGSPVTYRVRIIGQGNINTVQTPALPKMEDFKIYDSSSSANVSKERLVVEGEKITETVLVPKKTGTYTIPALGFSYFDPKVRTYKEVRTEPHTLNVKPNLLAESLDEGAPGVRPVEKEDVAVLSQDIRYIKTENRRPFLPIAVLYKNLLYWALNFALILLTFVFAVLAVRKDKGAADARGARLKHSHGAARKRLRSAATLLKRGKHDEFYAEIAKAMSLYFADKLDLPSQNTNAELIVEKLEEKGIEPEISNEVRRLFDELAHGRFSSMQKEADEMKQIYERADRLITRFEKMRLK